MKHLPQLDGLRALAVMMVFLHHAFQLPMLWAGVDLFFVLSGYLITNLLLRDAEQVRFWPMLGRFYTRRAARILPAYVLALVCLYPLVGADLRRYWVYYLLFLQNMPYAFHWIGLSALWPLWSLAVEQQFYLVWPVVVYFLPRRWLAPCLVAIVALSPVLRWVCTPLFSYPEVIYASAPFRLDGMALGGLAALWLPGCRRHKVVRWAQLAMLAGMVAYGVLSLHPWFRRGANTAVFNSLGYSLDLMVLGGLFLWATAAEGGMLVKLLSHSLVRALGRISYMFYLLHLGVLMVVLRRFPPVPATLIGFAVTVAMATVSWFGLERPILRLGRPQP